MVKCRNNQLQVKQLKRNYSSVRGRFFVQNSAIILSYNLINAKWSIL